MKFDQRLKAYKKTSDYFLVDIWKSDPDKSCPYETKHDLTWPQARAIWNRAMKNEKISRVEIWVEDWDMTEDDEDYVDNLFALVDVLEKKPCKWSLAEYLSSGDKADLYKYPCGWKA